MTSRAFAGAFASFDRRRPRSDIASSAEEALDLASQTSPDAVCSTCGFRAGTGYRPSEISNGTIGDAPIIVVTAFGSLETAVRAVQEGSLRLSFQAVRSGAGRRDVLRRALRATGPS